MAEFNGKQGRWVTTKNGKHVFLEEGDVIESTGHYIHKQDGNYVRVDDKALPESLVDKQEREIAEQQKRTKELTAEKNPDGVRQVTDGEYKEATQVAKDVVQKLMDKHTAKDYLSDSDLSETEINKAMDGKLDYNLACKVLATLSGKDLRGNVTTDDLARVLRKDYGLSVSNGVLKDMLGHINKAKFNPNVPNANIKNKSLLDITKKLPADTYIRIIGANGKEYRTGWVTPSTIKQGYTGLLADKPALSYKKAETTQLLKHKMVEIVIDDRKGV